MRPHNIRLQQHQAATYFDHPPMLEIVEKVAIEQCFDPTLFFLSELLSRIFLQGNYTICFFSVDKTIFQISKTIRRQIYWNN